MNLLYEPDDGEIEYWSELTHGREKKAAETERAKIVNWLKSLATPENGFLPRTLANWIEDGMHYENEDDIND